jgi:hypothetical protein
MSCNECEEILDKALDKNDPETVPVAYYRIENANIAIIGCRKHVKLVIDKLNE